MLDNALNNNTIIKVIIKAFRFNPIKHYFYYLGYIINLIIYYLLFKFNSDLFKTEKVLFKDFKI